MTVLLVTNFANICAIMLVTQACGRAWGKAGYGAALLISLPFYLLGLEMLPKSLFRRFPYRALAAFSEPLRLADLLLSPALALGERVVRLVPRKPTEKKLFIAREDFKYLTIESEKQGALGPIERGMIHSVVDFRNVRARDVMMPWEKTRAIRADASVEELFALCRETNLDRVPVITGKNTVSGLVNTFEVLLDRTPRRSVQSYERRVIKVSPSEEAGSLLRKLRAARAALVVVEDEKGAALGVVSVEALVGRLVKSRTI